MSDYSFESPVIISCFSFIIPLIQSRNRKIVQGLGKQSWQDSFSACSGEVHPMGQSEVIRMTKPMLVNNYDVYRNQVRFPDNLGIKPLTIRIVVSCTIAIVSTSFVFWDDLSTFPTHIH